MVRGSVPQKLQSQTNINVIKKHRNGCRHVKLKIKYKIDTNKRGNNAVGLYEGMNLRYLNSVT